MESQLALASASIQSTEATKQQSEALLHELKKLSELTTQQTQSVATSLTHAVEEIKLQITSANSVILQHIEKTHQQNEMLEKKTKMVVYSLAAALILLSIITLKLFIR